MLMLLLLSKPECLWLAARQLHMKPGLTVAVALRKETYYPVEEIVSVDQVTVYPEAVMRMRLQTVSSGL